MLELIGVTVVMVAGETIVMVALVFVRDRCNLAGAVLGQRFHRLSKPSVMRDATAK
jgi:hypothetical protein